MCVCVCVCAVQSFSLLFGAAWGFAEFLEVAGFAEPLRTGLPKILSLNWARKKKEMLLGEGFSERLTAIVEAHPAD